MLGYEIPVQTSLTKTFELSKSLGLNCFQVYLGPKTTYQVQDFTAEDLSNSKKYAEEVHMYVHCSLIANLAKDQAQKSFETVQKELDIVKQVPGSCVLHFGKVGTMQNIINNLNELSIPEMKREYALLLETAAGQGTEIGFNWDQIRQIFEGIDKYRIGLCLDTQHMFASGLADLRSPERAVELFDQVEDILGHKASLVHLNDSAKEWLSKVDRHENIGEGYIWSGKKDGLKYLVNRCTEEGIDMILETPEPETDIKFVRSLIK